jgi:hypothetical protein
VSPQTLMPEVVRHRMPVATSIQIDRERFYTFFYRRRMTLSSVGPFIGRCDGWASVMARKGHAGYYALDDLATALGMHVEALIHEIGTDGERERITVL